MYWICFGDSAKGLLACVRRSLDPQMEEADRILAMGDDYSQGDIADVTDRAARDGIIFPWDGEGDAQWKKDLIAQHRQTLDSLDQVDEVVVWCAKGNALEQCGLRYVASRLCARHIPIWLAEVDEIPLDALEKPRDVIGGASAVGVLTSSRALNLLLRLLPQPLLRRYAARIERRNRLKRASGGTVCYGTVGEMELDAADYFYKRRRLLSDAEQQRLAAEWARLQAENTPLRAMVNGKVQSVSAEHYDAAILSCVPAETQPAAVTVGRALAQIERETGNRVSDMLVFSRIRVLSAAGRIVTVRDAANYRDMTIRQIGG